MTTVMTSHCLALLPKLNDPDADLRYMGLNDLFKLLNAAPSSLLSTDYQSAARIVEGLLATLDDQNGEVQNQAIRCVGALVIKLPLDVLGPFVLKMSGIKVVHSVDRSIAATALRTFITAFPAPTPGKVPSDRTRDAYAIVNRVLVPRLLGYVAAPNSKDKTKAAVPVSGLLAVGSPTGTDPDAMDVVLDLIRCFGPLLQDGEKTAFLEALLQTIDHDRTSTVVRKKAIVAISSLALYMSEPMLQALVSRVVGGLQGRSGQPSSRRFLLSLLNSLSREVPDRLEPFVSQVVPLIFAEISQEAYSHAIDAAIDDEQDANPEDDETRETALMALEGLHLGCVKAMQSFTQDSVEAAICFSTFDPNRSVNAQNGDDDEETEQLGAGGDEDVEMEDEGFEQDEAFSDGDDASWKTRRCAAKVLAAILANVSDDALCRNGIYFHVIAPALIQQFPEREESVRLEIINAATILVQKTKDYSSFTKKPLLLAMDSSQYTVNGSNPSRKRRRMDSESDSQIVSGAYGSKLGLQSPAESPVPPSGPRAELARHTPDIVNEVSKLLKQSSMATIHLAVQLLSILIQVQRGSMGANLGKILDPLTGILGNKSTSIHNQSHGIIGSTSAASAGSVRIATLQLISAICDSHSSKLLAPHIPSLVPVIITNASDQSHKVSGEALSTIESVIKALTLPRAAGTPPQCKTYINLIYDMLAETVTSTRIDLDVRLKAIHALGVLIARVPGSKGQAIISTAKRAAALSIILDRLQNETTRLAAVQAADLILSSAEDETDLGSGWACPVLLELGAQLRKADRTLRMASVLALKNALHNPVTSADLDPSTIRTLVSSTLPLIDFHDLSYLDIGLSIMTRLINTNATNDLVTPEIVKVVCGLAPVAIGEQAFDHLLELVDCIGRHRAGKDLMAALMKDSRTGKNVTAVGKIVGVLLVASSNIVSDALNGFVKELKASRDKDRRCLIIAILGEAAFRLGASSPLQPSVFIEHFTSDTEPIPRTAAIALGRAAAANIDTYITPILEELNTPSSSHLALQAIREMLVAVPDAASSLPQQLEPIWQGLLDAASSDPKDLLLAECLGLVSVAEPGTYFMRLQAILGDKACPGPSRAMAIQAIRFALIEGDEAIDETIRPRIIDVLSTMLKDSDVENRRLALSALNSCLQHKLDLIIVSLPELIELVVHLTKIDNALIQEVQMGPFRHKVDSGLELRKSAYEALFSLLENSYTRMKHSDLFDCVLAGLADEHEIKMLCSLMLIKLADLDIAETRSRLDSIAEQLRAILMFKPKENAVKQELEKAIEANRAALKVAISIQNALMSKMTTTSATLKPAEASSSTGESGTRSPSLASQGELSNSNGQKWRNFWDWASKEHRVLMSGVQGEFKRQITETA